MSLGIFYQSDLNVWVSKLGYVGLSLTVMAETGLFFCFFFPGDSLLFTAGLLASQGIFNIKIITFLLIMSAIIGFTIGYGFGFYLYEWLSQRPDTWYFRKSYLEKAHRFYDKHGKKALLFGRFIPVVRTFVPLVAGMIKMPLGVYTIYNCLGAVLWIGLMTLSGYFLGSIIPDISDYLFCIVLVIIVISVLPGIIESLKKKV